MPTTRITLADLTDGDYGSWLFARLKAAFPLVDSTNFLGLMQGFASLNDAFLARYRRTAVLAQLIRRPFGQAPYVALVFLLCRTEGGILTPEAERDSKVLLEDVFKWAKGIGAEEVQIDNKAMDYGHPKLKTLLPDIGTRLFSVKTISE